MAVNPSAVCVGDNCIDNYLPPINRKFVGGNALNVAVHLQRAGLSSSYVGVVGNDGEGALVLQALQGQGVDTSHLQIQPGRTSWTDILLTSEKERQFIRETPGPVERIELDGEALAFVLRHSLIHTTWAGGTQECLPKLRHASSLVSFDYGERYSQEFVDQTIKSVDWAFFSVPVELSEQAEELAVRMFHRGPKLVVVTKGYLGSLAYDGKFYDQPAYPVTVVDTLGAGDTFIGVFIASRLCGKDIQKCLSLAAVAAAETCTHFGAWESDPIR